MSETRRTHDELHKAHEKEYNLIVDVDHDIALIDDHEYSSKQEGYEDVTALKTRSRELRNLLDEGKMDEFQEKLVLLRDKANRAPKIR